MNNFKTYKYICVPEEIHKELKELKKVSALSIAAILKVSMPKIKATIQNLK